MSEEVELGSLVTRLDVDVSKLNSQIPKANAKLRDLQKEFGKVTTATANFNKASKSNSSVLSDFVQSAVLVRTAVSNIREVLVSFPASLSSGSGELERLGKLMVSLRSETDQTAKSIGGLQGYKGLSGTDKGNRGIGQSQYSPQYFSQRSENYALQSQKLTELLSLKGANLAADTASLQAGSSLAAQQTAGLNVKNQEIAAIRQSVEENGAYSSSTGNVINGTKEAATATKALAAEKELLTQKGSGLSSGLKTLAGSIGSTILQMGVETAATYAANVAWEAFNSWLDNTIRKEMLLAEAVNAVNKGIQTQAEISRLKNRSSEIDQELHNGGTYSIDDNGFSSFIPTSARRRSELEKEKEKVDFALDRVNLRQDRQNWDTLFRVANEDINSYTEGYQQLISQYVSKAEKAHQNGDTQLEQANRAKIKSLQANFEKRRDGILQVLREDINKNKVLLKNVEAGSSQQDDLLAKIARSEAGIRELESGKKTVSGSVGGRSKTKLNAIKNRGGYAVAEKDGITSWIEQIKTQTVALKAENISLEQGISDYASIAEKAKAIVEGKIAAGAWDQKTRGQNNEVTGLGKFGGESRTDLSASEQKRKEDAIQAQIAFQKETDARQLLTSTNSRLTETQASLNQSFLGLDSEFQKHSSGIQTLLKQYAALDGKTAGLGDSTKTAIDRQRTRTLALQSGVDASNSLASVTKSLKDIEISSIIDTEERRDAKHKRNLTLIDDEYKKQTESINNGLAQEKEGTEVYKNLLMAKEVATRKYYAQMKYEGLRYQEEDKTQLRQLGDKWQNVSGQMDTASASWASGFMDVMVKACNTGKIEWRGFLAGMLTDINRILIQKTFGRFIESGFDSIGKGASGLIGFITQGLNPNQQNAAPNATAAIGNPLMSNPYSGFYNSAFGYNPYNPGFGSPFLPNAYPGIMNNVIGSQQPNASGMGSQLLSNTSSDFIKNTFGNDLLMAGDDVTNFGMNITQAGQQTGLLNSILQFFGLTTQATTALEESSSFSASLSLGGLSLAADEAAFSLMSMAASSGGGEGGGFFGSVLSAFGSSFSANGNIISSSGPVALRRYAKGGIANSPHLAIFGEGSMNEAFVPLPDGRSIPVSFANGSGVAEGVSPNGSVPMGNGLAIAGGNAANSPVIINIEVNEGDGGSSKTSSSGGSDTKMWQGLANKVKNLVLEEIGNQKRPGGLLYGK